MYHKNGYRFTSLVVVMILLTGILPVQAEALTSPLYASGDFLWAKSMGGVSGDGATSFVMDSSDNIYLTGSFQDTVDFDPGVGIDNLTSAGLTDIFISKLDSSGSYVWAKSMGGVSNDSAISIALDADGNIYLTGSFQGTADFDPGIGIYNLTSAGLNDTFIAKLNSSGNFLWAKQIGGTGSDNARSITVSIGNVVYISGIFQLTADFDPGAGISNLTSAGGFDIYISKLDSSGNLVWVKQIGGTSNDLGRSKADASGNVYTIGEFQGTVDFDPSTSTFNLTSAGLGDVFVSKLDGGGNFLWAIREGGVGEDYGTSITPSANGDIYTTRTSYPQDLFIEKLDSNGNLVWEKIIHTTVEIYGTKIIQDPIGNIYAIGDFAGSADFDPGVGVFNMTSANDFWFDIFVIKLDSTGGFVWAKRVGGAGDESSRDITLDSGGNVYTTGRFEGTVDFDSGAGTFDLTSAGGSDIFISKLENVVAPVVISVVRADPNPTNATSVNFTVTFSESVTGVNIAPLSDFTLTTTGVTGAAITGVNGSDNNYTVTVNTGSGNGTIRLDIPDTATIADLAGNPLANLPFITGEAYDINKEKILNGGFNIYPVGKKIPTSWKAVNFSTSDGKITTVKQEGTASVRIIGTGVSKTLSQTLLLSGLTGDTFNFSFWMKGKSIPTAGVCRAQVLFYNGTTLNPVKKTINCTNGTSAFTQKSLAFTAPGNYTKIIVRFTYNKASGTVWFDAVSLLR